jgi:hypothetical protein
MEGSSGECGPTGTTERLRVSTRALVALAVDGLKPGNVGAVVRRHVFRVAFSIIPGGTFIIQSVLQLLLGLMVEFLVFTVGLTSFLKPVAFG